MTNPVTLTEGMVLRAVDAAAAPRSAYIADRVRRAHGPARQGLILARLRSLEDKGLIECKGGPDGCYGYEWRITLAGRIHLRDYYEAERC